MAGTNRNATNIQTNGPTIILVEPALPENVGMTARAMLNCGLTDLRLINPKWVQDGEPLLHGRAIAASAGGDSVLSAMRAFDSLEAAIADITYLVATSPRKHDMHKPVYNPDDALCKIKDAISEGEKCAVMFGCEKSGLTNQHITLANFILEIPLNPAYSSLNLAQAVLIVAYEWTKISEKIKLRKVKLLKSVSREELKEFFNHLEKELEISGFLRVEEKRDVMIQNIRNIFTRISLEPQEIRTLHGIITYLTKHPDEKAFFKEFYTQQKERRRMKKEANTLSSPEKKEP
jgi:tRNA/rRNA methyltransferase